MVLGKTPVEGRQRRQVSAEGEVELRGSSDKGLSQPHGELGSSDDPSELSQVGVRNSGLCTSTLICLGIGPTLEGGMFSSNQDNLQRGLTAEGCLPATLG